MANNEVPFFNSSEWEQKHLEEILKNPPKPVSFTYTIPSSYFTNSTRTTIKRTTNKSC